MTPSAESLHIHLPPHMVVALNEAISSGQYHTPDEVVLVALEQWRLRQKVLREELRALWDEGRASGVSEPFTIEEFLAEARAMPKGD